MRAASARQKTLSSAIGWSYSLLSAEEQKLFAYLSVFSGGFTLSAAESIFSQRFTEKSVPDLIASLLDKSLLQRSSALHVEVRFTMLVTIQQFALTCLRQMSQEAQVRDWHLAYFLDLAEQADKHIHGTDQLKWIDSVEDELDNFRAVLHWCVSDQRTESALVLLTSLSDAWDRRDHSHEIRNWFDAIRLLPGVVDRPLHYARLLNHISQHSWVLGDFDHAKSALEESHAILVNLGVEGEPDLAMNFCWFGMVAHTGEADNKAARSFYEHSLELYQKHGNLWGMAFVSLSLGITISEWNDDDSALPLFKQSLEWFRQLGDTWGMARTSQFLGQLFLRQGNYERARLHFEDHLKIDESLRYTQGTAIALQNLGNLYRYQGDYDQATRLYEKSLVICREYGESWGLSNSLWYLGIVALHRNDYQQARQQFSDCYQLARVMFEKISMCDLLPALAAVAAETHQSERAAKLYGAAQALFETTDYRLQPFDRAEFDRHIRIAEEQLGGAKFEELVSEGYAMTMEQAIAYALEEQGN
jgi:tetratricopeptide (TPR) repeat protein